MTTKVVVSPAGHHVLVTVTDKRTSDGEVELTHNATLLQPAFHYVDGAYTPTGQGPWEGYATTSRSITVLDLDPLDPRVEAANGEFNSPVNKPT
jgi:hypothetical protein